MRRVDVTSCIWHVAWPSLRNNISEKIQNNKTYAAFILRSHQKTPIMIGSPFYIGNHGFLLLKAPFGPLSSRDLSINDAIISPARLIVRSPSWLPCWNYRMRWLMVTGCLLWLTLINHHSWIFNNFYSNPYLLEIHSLMNGTWSFKSFAENSNVKLWGSSSIASPLCWSWSSTRWMKSGWTLNINFSDVGSCRSSATSDLQFAGCVSQKSPRKRWTLLFLGCKRQPLPKQSTTTMIRHVLERLDLTGLRRNIRKINSKAKARYAASITFGKTPGFSSSTSLTKKHVENP